MADMQSTLNELERVLNRMLEGHAVLLELVQHKREALRRGDTAGMAHLSSRENASVQAVSDLEKQRLALVAQLTQMVRPQGDQPMRLGELIELLPSPQRQRLADLREQLVQRMRQVQEQTSVARRATQTLLRHVQGLMQGLAALTCDAGAYGRGGTRPASAGSLRTMDMTA